MTLRRSVVQRSRVKGQRCPRFMNRMINEEDNTCNKIMILLISYTTHTNVVWPTLLLQSVADLCFQESTTHQMLSNELCRSASTSPDSSVLNCRTNMSLSGKLDNRSSRSNKVNTEWNSSSYAIKELKQIKRQSNRPISGLAVPLIV